MISRLNSGILFLVFYLFCTIHLHAYSSDEARISNRAGIQKAASGDWEGAIDLFRRARAISPGDETTLANLASAYNNLGVKLCRNEQYRDAVACFLNAKKIKPEDLDMRFNLLSALVMIRDSERIEMESGEILALRPNDSNVILKVASAFSKVEDDESARNLLEKILVNSPENPKALYQIGQLCYKQGNTTDAKFYLEQARENSPGHASACLLLKKIEREDKIESKYLKERSINFTLTYCEQISSELAQSILEVLENAYTKVGEFIGFYPAQRTEVIVYTPHEFSEVSTLPYWAGGLYDGKLRIPVFPNQATIGNLQKVVFHEYCHHIVNILSAGKCPLWLNEGLAQLAEGTNPEKARTLLEPYSSEKIIPLTKMNENFPDTEDRKNVERLYAQSLVATGILIADNGIDSVRNVLKALAKRDKLEDALFRFTSQDIRSLEEKLYSAIETSDFFSASNNKMTPDLEESILE
ncbi:MAG: tetratricopeptide repeat protein [Candidatus Riflebacteria bacterium]|nr:tetratricopeptide repeat protein [Candidatus Riflebacteria bacterium]